MLQILLEETRSKRQILSRLHQKTSSRRPPRWIPFPAQTPSAKVPHYLPRYWCRQLHKLSEAAAFPTSEALFCFCSRVTSSAATLFPQATQNQKDQVEMKSVRFRSRDEEMKGHVGLVQALLKQQSSWLVLLFVQIYLIKGFSGS